MNEENAIHIPQDINYIACFLTFACQLRCTYCINHHGGDLVKRRWMSGEDWIKAINRIPYKSDLPITLQGGEPTVHKHFYQIVQGVREDIKFDLLTNLETSVTKFAKEVPVARFNRQAPYASIRVSYHHGQSVFRDLIEKVHFLQSGGYNIGVWEVDHPEYHDDVLRRQEKAKSIGIDYRLKEFLGPHKGVNYGTMRYEDAVNSRELRSCMCKSSELLIDPQGDVYRCHSDLYAQRACQGSVLSDTYTGDTLGKYTKCAVYGKCNSCDVKVTYNRFQEHGHSSVEIKDVSEHTRPNKEYVEEVQNTYGKK